ncbi:MAG: hypothetical protein U9R43_14290, partial [Thermodesulfobacteriota bacterium]|nr:hypothetical protein [Thermodesulfobacteriota bacterium]
CSCTNFSVLPECALKILPGLGRHGVWPKNHVYYFPIIVFDFRKSIKLNHVPLRKITGTMVSTVKSGILNSSSMIQGIQRKEEFDRWY